MQVLRTTPACRLSSRRPLLLDVGGPHDRFRVCQQPTLQEQGRHRSFDRADKATPTTHIVEGRRMLFNCKRFVPSTGPNRLPPLLVVPFPCFTVVLSPSYAGFLSCAKFCGHGTLPFCWRVSPGRCESPAGGRTPPPYDIKTPFGPGTDCRCF